MWDETQKIREFLHFDVEYLKKLLFFTKNKTEFYKNESKSHRMHQLHKNEKRTFHKLKFLYLDKSTKIA